MSNPIPAVEIDQLKDTHWRRLGITQTFDRMLVEAVALAPGARSEIFERVGTQFQGGAAKFWEMSAPQILRDLCRRKVLAESLDQVALVDDFQEKLTHIVSGLHAGDSSIVPTSGMSVEEIQAKAEARQKRDTVAKKAVTKKPTSKASGTPLKRSKDDEGPAERVPRMPTPPPMVEMTPIEKLFTSKRLNRMLEALEHAPITLGMLGTKLELPNADVRRFIDITHEQGLTRSTGDQIELHWQGRELAQTQDTDRRMALREVVKTLRDKGRSMDV